MTIKLSDTQLVMLSAAAQRDDRCLVAGQNLKGGAAQKIAAKLIDLGIAREIRAKAGAPVCRRDAAGEAFALKLTAAGLKAIAVEDDANAAPAKDAAGVGKGAAMMASAAAAAAAAAAGAGDAARPGDDAGAPEPGGAIRPGAPRSGSKLASLIALMQRPAGATIGELTSATGWLAHTTRAAITGLRQRDYPVSLDRTDRMRGSIYRIGTKGSAGARANDEVAACHDPVAPAQARRARRLSDKVLLEAA